MRNDTFGRATPQWQSRLLTTILATTADTDDRVVPGHTFKYVAAFQATDIGPKPRLARIETRAGHGGGKPIDKYIGETADMWAFAAHWTGLEVKPVEQSPQAKP